MARSRYSYYRQSRASFWETARENLDRGVVDETWVRHETLTAEGREDGLRWEFVIEAYQFNDRSQSLRVCTFGDAFAAFAEKPGFFAALAQATKDDGAVSLDDVERLLAEQGFQEVQV